MPASVVVVTDSNFEQEVTNSTVPVLLDFWAPWCGPCKALDPTIERLAIDFEGRAKIAKLNVDDNPKTADRFNIRGVPTLLLFNDGKLKENIRSTRTLNALSKFMEWQLAGPSKKEVLTEDLTEPSVRAMFFFQSSIETISATLKEQPQLAHLPLNEGVSPLSYAIRNRRSELVRELLLYDPKKTFYDLAAGGFAQELAMRIAEDNIEELNSAADNLEPLLVGAIRNGHYQCIDLLLDAGINPNARSGRFHETLMAALQTQDVAICEHMADRGLDFSAYVSDEWDAIRF